jgi:pimeloyl-ACP methyl ester carboxylesterase
MWTWRLLQMLCRYRIHCLGHSLGGGVAALAAWLLRTTPELKQQLQGASGVMATGNGGKPATVGFSILSILPPCR